jgi:hypothetical protein
MLEVPENAADAPVVQVAREEPAAPVRRRGRTALLIAGAALLGLVGGTCTGYLIQADRSPTALPPLSQPKLAQAKGKAPEPLSAARDRQVKTDGDLRKLLLKKPGGAKTADWTPGDGWMDLYAYAETYEEPRNMFGRLITDEFRRAAVTGWQSGAQTAEIRLIQFRQQESLEASDSTDSSQYWADREPETDSWSVPGTGNGITDRIPSPAICRCTAPRRTPTAVTSPWRSGSTTASRSPRPASWTWPSGRWSGCERERE